MSFGSSKTKTSSNSKTEPWAPAIPTLQSFIGKANAVGGLDITPDQKVAFEALKSNAAGGNPWTPQIAQLADDAFAYQGDSGSKTMATDAYSTLQNNLGKYAAGDYLDVTNNPELKAMLDMVGGSVQDRINRQFQGMGRSRSGINQQSVGRGVTEAQLPLLLDQFNKQQQNQIAASQALYGAGSNTAGQIAGFDQNTLDQRAKGITYANEALGAKDYSANKILDLDQQIQQLPYENLALLGSLILPAAGLGGETDSKGKSKTSGFSISDERMKENIHEVGELADGQPLYSFSYKDDPDHRTHVGLMAQDVEDEIPEAVREFNGVKAVDYGMATARAAQIVKRQMAKRKGH